MNADDDLLVAKSAAVVGREPEVALLHAFLSGAEELPLALVLHGDAGIGKTTLWREGVAIAQARGFRVLASSPSGSELELAYAALADLLADVGEVLVELHAPQRRALNAALLVEDVAEGPDPRATAAGLLNVVRGLARSAPLLLAIDDVQWLDPESAAALEFAVRRLRSVPVAVLIARREGVGDDRLERALPPDRVRRIGVGPLTLGAVHELIKERLGTTFPRPIVHRLRETSGGNPFFALELARAIVRRGGAVAAGEELPVPGTLRELVAAHISELPDETLGALRVASTLAAATPDVVSAVIDGDALAALAPAFEAELLELREGRLVFAHPLFAAAVYADLAPHERRALHRRVAAVVAEPEQRARHLALSVAGPDAEVAAALRVAAERAAARGAPAAAAELMELAVRLTPADAAHERNLQRLRAADLHLTAGSEERAHSLLVELERELPPGNERAQVLLRLADEETSATAVSRLEQALALAVDDRELVGELEHYLGFQHAFLGDVDTGRAHVRRSLALLGGADESLLAEALAGHVLLETFAAEPVAAGLLERAISLERRCGGPPRFRSPVKVAAIRHLFHGRVAEARPFLEEYKSRAVAYGDEQLHVNALSLEVELECRAGHFELAEQRVRELAEFGQDDVDRLDADMAQALVAAYCGRVEEVCSLAPALRSVNVWSAAMADSLLGFVALSRGELAAAWQILEPLPDRFEAMGYREIGFLPPLYIDAVEAAVAAGELERAHEFLGRLERRARRTGSEAGLIAAARGAGLVAAAAGAHEEASAAFERALAAEARAPDPFERARVLLALGSTRRRGKRWAQARERLAAAVSLFEQLGTQLWVERAREELARVPGRAPRGLQLTPTERRIAELVAEGRANKEVAAALFVSVKAVEANLSRVYAKLGLRSRTELARRFAREGEPKL